MMGVGEDDVKDGVGLKGVICRLHTDYFQPNRTKDYYEIIQSAIEHGYIVCSVLSFHSQIIDPDKKYLILRHDQDTNPSFALEFAKVEQKFGISASYYFRLNTAKTKVMQELYSLGHEVGYHYEEISSMCRVKGYYTRSQVDENIGVSQDMFTHNLAQLRKTTGLPITTAASHGDFITRKTGISNNILLEDMSLRARNSIELEAYDILKGNKNVIAHTDFFYPSHYTPYSPVDSIQNGTKVIHFLSHPRYWKASAFENTKFNLDRLVEGIKYERKLKVR